jgi:hypothetical protein
MAKQQADGVTDANTKGPEIDPGALDFAGAALPWEPGGAAPWRFHHVYLPSGPGTRTKTRKYVKRSLE